MEIPQSLLFPKHTTRTTLWREADLEARDQLFLEFVATATVSATPYPTTRATFVRRLPCTTIHAKTSRKHLFSTSELQRGCCAGSKKLVRHFENAPDWNVFATSRSKFEKRLMRHVAAKRPSASRSLVFVGKRIHIRVILCLCKGCKEKAGSDGDDIGIARLLMATAAMKNQTDRFYTAAIVFAGRSVYTTLLNPPFLPYNG